MKEIIRMEDVSFGFEQEPIFEKIGFSVFEGEYVVIIGANGAGKSTLMKLLLQDVVAKNGSIQWFGEDIKKFRSWEKIGYVPQHNPLMGNAFPATVEEIVLANLYKEIGLFRFAKKSHREKVMDALALVGMDSYHKRLIGNLSGGQQQKVMLARALVTQPQVLLLDEPTTGVDSKSCEELYQLFHQLNQEKQITILMISHDMSRALQQASKVLFVQECNILHLEQEEVSALMTQPFFGTKGWK